jgi:hypothetical protein
MRCSCLGKVCPHEGNKHPHFVALGNQPSILLSDIAGYDKPSAAAPARQLRPATSVS